jgi:hypothetical protein
MMKLKSNIRRSLYVLVALQGLAIGCGAAAAEEIGYGSRVGMSATVTSKSGVNSEKAVVFFKHTAENAKEFCVGYSNDYSMKCVKSVLRETKLKDHATANCRTGRFYSVWGQEFEFRGKNRNVGNNDIMADYIIVDVGTGETLDGSSASSYPVVLDNFSVMCPARVR